MYKPSLNILIMGLTDPEHVAFSRDIGKADASIRYNKQPLDAAGFGEVLQRGAVDAVFIRRKSGADLSRLHQLLSDNNRDCIVVELTDAASRPVDIKDDSVLQACRIIFDPFRPEFILAVQFVFQYTRLKMDFRRCKSLLHLSETRVSRLVNSSSIAIAYLHQGKILHANIPFLVLFKADSVSEVKRFPLLKLIASDEREVFANYLAQVRQTPEPNTELTLTLKRVNGIPFYAKVNISPVVLGEHRCYQLWVREVPKFSKPEVIPVTKSLNVWDVPEDMDDTIHVNPFDQVLEDRQPSLSRHRKETSMDVLLDALQHDESVMLRFRELYRLGQGALNHVWMDLDVQPDEFRKINQLLAKMPEVASNSMVFGHFWDRLLFRMVFDELLHASSPERIYLVSLSTSMVSDGETIIWLRKMLEQLNSHGTQVMLVVDAQIPMNRIPATQKVIELLRGSGCQIALNNFSVDTTPLFLYRRIQPETVFLDDQWLDVLKERPDGNVFLSKFVRQIEGRGVKVIIPHAIQKSQDRLLVLSGSSFGQENPAQDCA